MRHCLRSFLVLALPLSILAACGTDRESGSPVDTALDLTGVASFCDDAEILADIEAIFPTSQRLRHVATVTCGQVFDAFGKSKQTEAVEKAFAFFLKTLQQNDAGQLLDPDPSTEAKIVELFTAIFEGIGFDIPEIDPQVLMDGEYAIGTLIPGGPPLITGSLHAGIGDPDGTGLFGPVTAFIVMIEAEEGEIIVSSVEHPCPTGIEGNEDVGDFDCYPLFYDYSVSPESNVNPAVGLQLGQCNVSPEGVEVELLTPEGFLPLDDAPNGLDCSDVEPEVTMTGWRSYAWTVLEPVSPLFRVTPAFAGQSPIGGRISNFSPVAPADPNSGAGIGSISGRVFYIGDDSPIPGATVNLSDGEVVVASTTTAADGTYSFTELDLGTYVVQASAPGFFPDSSGPVELTEENPDAENVDVGLVQAIG